MKTLTITGRRRGKYKQKVGEAVVDDALHPVLSRHTWCSSNEYPMTKVPVNGRPKTIYLHQAVWLLSGRLLPKRPLQIDHIDRDPKNNLLSNLREATVTLQRVNSGLRRDNASGYKGVSCHKPSKRWIAHISDGVKVRHLGSFRSPEGAYAAYTLAHLGLHGIPPVVNRNGRDAPLLPPYPAQFPVEPPHPVFATEPEPGCTTV